MRDVTPEITSYRKCVVEVWNDFFANKADADQHDCWANACVELFRALVLHPIDRDEQQLFPDHHGHEREPLRFLHVEPIGTCEILFNNVPNKQFGSWTFERPASITAGDADLRFVWFFDWSWERQRSFEFILVRTATSTKYPQAADRYALVRTADVKVLFDEASV